MVVRMNSSCPQLRRGNSNWLVHTLLHSSISMLVPLVEAYRGRLKHFKYKLEELALNFCYLGLDKQVLDIKMGKCCV